MKSLTLFLSFLLALAAGAQTTTTSKPNYDRTIYATAYGATAGDATDDRNAIQTALNAAATGGGGVVMLGPGAYRVYVVYDSTTTHGGGKTKHNGHYGLEIPAGVTLRGSGMEATAVVGYVTTENGDTGAIIAPQGWRAADVAYECGAPVLQSLSVYAADTAAEETGICIAAVHSDGFRIDNVRIGPALYHGIDHDYARGTTVTRCRFRGPFSSAVTGSPLQFDAGDMGAGSTHLSLSAAPNASISIEDTIFEQRPSTDTSTRDIDLAHGACQVRGLRFVRCDFYGRNNSTDTNIVDIDTSSTTGVYNNVDFLHCRFFVYADAGNDVNDRAINAQLGVTTGEVQRWRIESCEFWGQPLNFIAAGSGSGSSVTAALWAGFKGWKITGNTFNFDASSMAGGAVKSSILAYGLQEAVISANSVWHTGAEASATTVYPYRLNNTSGSLFGNSCDQAGTISAYIPYVNESAGAETAVQAATIPHWRFAAYGNDSRGTTSSGHYFFRGANGIDGGSAYNFAFWNNTFHGTGSVDLAYQYFASPSNNAYGGGQVLGISGTVNFASMAAGAEDTQTLTVTGARTGATATVDVGWSAALESGIGVKQAWVSAADTVSITVRNTSAGTIDPASLTGRVTVRQF